MTQPTNKFTKTRAELAQRYFTFGSTIDLYSTGNMGIISLLSDVQHAMQFGCAGQHESDILNDIKCVLATEERENNQCPTCGMQYTAHRATCYCYEDGGDE